MSKILVVKDEVSNKNWMNHMPVPLVAKTKVVVHNNQDNVVTGYVRVKHGQGAVSVWNRNYFKELGK